MRRTGEHMRRVMTVIALACALAASGCSAQGPLDVAEERIQEVLAKGPDMMAGLTVGKDTVRVDLVRNEARLVWDLYPEPSAPLTPSIEAQSESVYDKVPVMPTSEFPVEATLERARLAEKECVDDYDAYEVEAVAVSRYAVLTTVGCSFMDSSAHLDDIEMPVLATDFSEASLQSLWEELEVIAPKGLVESMYFDRGVLSVSVASFGDGDPTCRRSWFRDLADPAQSFASCFEPNDELGWIDFERLTPQRLSSFVDAAEAELEAKGERSKYVVGIFLDETGETILRLAHGDDDIRVPL